MMRSLRAVGLFTLALLLSSPIFAATDEADRAESPIKFSLLGLRTYTLFGFLPAPTGLDAVVSYTGLEIWPGRTTSIDLKFGAGFEREVFYRYADGTPYSGAYESGDVDFDTAGGVVDLGIVQGIVPKLDAFLFLRAAYRYNIDNGSTVFNSAFADRGGALTNSLLAGVSYSNVRENADHKTRNGLYAEASMEWGPGFLANSLVGESDYLRLNSVAKAFLTLFDAAPEREKNLFSIYLGDYLSVDWATGTAIPIMVQQTFGGRSIRKGLGGSLRGYENRSYDTRFKLVNNLEARFVGPALGLKDLVPLAAVFVDAGYYAGLEGAAVDPGPGFLASVGGMLSVDVLDLAYLGATFTAPLAGSRVDGKNFEIKVRLSLHF